MALFQCRVSSNGAHGTPPWMNVFHVSCSPEDNDTVADALPSIFQTFYDALATDLQLGTAWNCFERLTDIAVDPPVIYNPTVKTSVPTGTGDPAPTQLAAVLSWHTGLAGPRYRGRSYIGPVRLSAIANGGVSAGFQTDLEDAGAALISSIASISGVSNAPYLAVASRFTNPTTITSCSTGPRWRTQRRRN